MVTDSMGSWSTTGTTATQINGELHFCSNIRNHMPSANKRSWLLLLPPTAAKPTEHGKEGKTYFFQPAMVAFFSSMDGNDILHPLQSLTSPVLVAVLV